MKRERSSSSSLQNIHQNSSGLLPSSGSPPPHSSSSGNMSKRSRGGGGRYHHGGGGGGVDNNGDDPDSPLDNRSHHSGHGGSRHHSDSGRSPPNNNGSSARRHGGGGGDDYGRNYPSGGGYKDHRSSSSLPRGGPPSGSSSSSSSYPYKVLCMSRLSPKASDEFIRDSLYREFKRYGDISVKVVNETDERVAYVYFRSAEDAREVKHSKVPIYIYDRPLKVEAAYESAPQTSNHSSHSGGGGYKGQGPPLHQQEPPLYDKYSSSRSSASFYSSSSYANRSPPIHSHSSYDSRGGGGGGRGGGDDRGGGYNDRGGYGPPSGGGSLPPPHHHSHHHQQPPHQGPPIYSNQGGGGGRDYNRGDYRQQPYGRYPPGPQSHHSSHMHPPPPGGGPHHSLGGGGGPPPPSGGGGGGRYHPPGPGGPMHLDQSMGPPPMGGGGGGGQGGHHMGGGVGGPRGGYENKKDKFPNYLQHITPEEDPLATRTLFAGNLEVNITDEELRRIFGRYGVLEDIDIKRPPPGTGNAYAFVRFVNLDMAARAKSEVSGQYIGKFQCKIGYGKRNPTTKVWVGGLGPWTTLQMLEREFDRFGSIKNIDWEKGGGFAYITYETIDAAQAAVKDMRGYPLGGTDKRLRTDFADAGAPIVAGGGGDFFGGGGGGDNNWGTTNNGGNNGNKRGNSSIKTASPHSSNDLASPGGPVSDDEGDSSGPSLSGARTITEISTRAPVAWTGGLILKISSFPTRFFLTDGGLEGVDALLKDEDGRSQLKITQRLKLDQGKLDDVSKRISSSKTHGIFLALPATTSNLSSPKNAGGGGEENVQSRPLRNLVSYLKTKDAAGVISSTIKGGVGVVYVFPPCPFSWALLKRGVPGLAGDGGGDGKEQQDHLVVVVIN